MSHDTWIHHVARAAVRPMIGTRIQPNHLTTFRLLTGLAAASAFAVGAAPWPDVGGVLFVFSMVLDRADGELARLSAKTSAGGHTYDLVADSVCNMSAFIGLGVGLRESAPGFWAIPLGVLAGAAVAGILWLTLRLEERRGARAAELKSICGFDVDDAVLIVPVAVWLGWSVPLLVVAAIGAPAFLVFFSWHCGRRLARP